MTNCQRGGKTVICSEEHDVCECPPWAEGNNCENLNMAYNLDLLPWKKGHGGNLKTVDISFTETWCTTNFDGIYHLQNGKWVKVSGLLQKISVGENGLWGTNSFQYIFPRLGITASEPKGTQWYLDTSGLLSQVTSGRPGILWGVNVYNQLYYKQKSGTWSLIGVYYIWVSCGKFGCWAIVRGNGHAYFRTGVTADVPGGVSWVDTGGTFTQLDTGVRGDVYAVDGGGQLYTREGISEDLPYGRKWSKFGNFLLSHVSVGAKSVIGIHNELFYTMDTP
ncbi:fish-egg lectin-like [Dendronephthya gigantea]|uniref:fish-egg lectin-like n=1 Tax=Dendronephthya gigantea TaxID=151771 RepID=UPI00106D8ADC|nr:fish-egg lectin-like [Dendronephthya gigantea]XP_028407932.1 fish-egg lectin-like [Dendronephthya gigantea]